MGDGAVSVFSVYPLGEWVDGSPERGIGGIDVGEHGAKDEEHQIPRIGEDVDAGYGAKDAGENDAAGDVVWEGHSN